MKTARRSTPNPWFTVVILLATGIALTVAAKSQRQDRSVLSTGQASPADADASFAERAMSSAYASAWSRLSAPGRLALRDSQRSFLRYLGDLCRPGGRPLDVDARLQTWQGTARPSDRAIVAQCLAQTITGRATELRLAVLPLAGHVFLSTKHYRVRAATKTPASMPNWHAVVTETSTLVQIDAPRSKTDDDFNGAMRASLDRARNFFGEEEGAFDTNDVDVDAEERVVAASPDLWVTSTDVGSYVTGQAHGQSASWTTNWSLKLDRPLVATDIFDAAKPWATELAKVAVASLEAMKEPTIMFADNQRIVTIDEVDHWLLTPEGLRLSYDPYAFGCYPCTGEVVLPWADLNPYLRPDMPFDPSALRVPPTGR